MILYDYYRSSAAYRVRIALNLKSLAYEKVPVNLLQSEQKSASYGQLNPQGLVPALNDNGHVLTQSLSICEYLDEEYPDSPSLVFGTPVDKANIRSLSQIIACDIHPVDNLRVLKYLEKEFEADEQQKMSWYRHWIIEGFNALECQLKALKHSGVYSYGDQPSLVDVCLIPQIYNAKRFNVDLTAYPQLMKIEAHCNTEAAFMRAHPDQNPGA
jgi:maleylpyruvate isomerase